MIKWVQWGVLGFLALLVVSLGALHAQERWPAENYIDSMARGQYTRARHFLEEQVLAGNPRSQNALANLYYLGLGGSVDFVGAANLYHSASSQGFGAAQLNLGHLYKQGLGVSKNAERAFAWYMHANISRSTWAEYYMSQISVELTLTPLQMNAVKERWRRLDTLVNEPLFDEPL